MRKTLAAVAAVALAFPLMATSARAAEPSEMVRHMNQINLEEIELGHYAADHAERHDLKEYGRMLADDHQSAAEELRRVAHHLDMHLRDDLDDEHRHEVDHLEHLHGHEFDRAFVHAMVQGHEDAIKLFEDVKDHAQHREVREYAAAQLPHLHHHLDRAHEMEHGG